VNSQDQEILRNKILLRAIETGANIQTVARFLPLIRTEKLAFFLECHASSFQEAFEHAAASRLKEICDAASEDKPKWEEWSVDELCSKAQETNPDAILSAQDNYMARGSAMVLVATTGAGKSSYAMQQAVWLSNGQEFCGQKPAGQLSFLILQNENDAYDTGEAMRDSIVNFAKVHGKTVEEVQKVCNEKIYIRRVHCSGDDLPIIIKQMLASIKEKYGVTIDVVTVDPLLGFFGGLLDPDRTQQWLYTVISPLMHECKFLLMLTHHSTAFEGRSNGAGLNNSYSSFGGAILPGWVRAVINLQPSQDPDVFLLRYEKRKKRLGSKPIWALRQNKDGVCWDILDDKEAEPFIEAVTPKIKKGRIQNPVLPIEKQALAAQNKALEERHERNMLYTSIASEFEYCKVAPTADLLKQVKVRLNCGQRKCYMTLQEMVLCGFVKKERAGGYTWLQHPDKPEVF
jgi:RecA-family ATPase